MYLYIYFFLLLLLLAWGCALHSSLSQSQSLSTPQEMSAEAKAIFNYLKYQGLLKQNKSEQAIKALKKAIQLDSAPSLYLEQAYFYWQRQNFEQSEVILKDGLRQFPHHKQLTFALSKLYEAQDKPEQAISILKSYLKNNPVDKEASLCLGRIYNKQQQFTQTLDLLKAFPKKDRDADIHYLLAQAYSRQENRTQSIKHLKQATELRPSFLEAWADLAYEYEMSKDYVAAAQTYSKLLDKGVDNREIYIRLIDLHLKLNDPQKAFQFVKKGPENDNFYLAACTLYLQNNFYEFVKNIFDLLSPEGKNLPSTLFYQAIVAIKADNDSSRALQVLKKIKPESKFYNKSLSLQCNLYFDQGQEKKAREIAQKGQNLFPQEEDFYLLESKILCSQNKYDLAFNVLRNSLKHLSKNTEILFQIGILTHKLGNQKEALNYMERIINIDPEHAKALNFVGYTFAEQGKNFKRALILINKALELEPKNGYFLDSLAWLYYKTGKLHLAWDKITEAISIVKDDPIIWEHYADIAKALKKTKKATYGYRQALQLGPENPEQIKRKLKNMQILPEL